eukprot:scaffold8082_cov258-Pinguiococcus_pyrenoidosus.AAC.1
MGATSVSQRGSLEWLLPPRHAHLEKVENTAPCGTAPHVSRHSHAKVCGQKSGSKDQYQNHFVAFHLESDHHQNLRSRPAHALFHFTFVQALQPSLSLHQKLSVP